MKKIMAIAVVLLVLGTAGSVFAYGGRGGACGRGGGRYGYGMGGGQGYYDCVGGGWGMMGGGWGDQYGYAEVPQEIRDKQVELEKTAIDLRSEMSRRPMDRAKVSALQKKHLELRNEVSNWFMEQQLDTMEKLQK